MDKTAGRVSLDLESLARSVRGQWPWSGHLRALIRLRGWKSYRAFVRASQETEHPVALTTLNYLLTNSRPPKPETVDRILRALDATPADLMRATPLPVERINTRGRPGGRGRPVDVT
jgi:hypothetical protein